MRLPTGQYEGIEWYSGARDFWRGELKRLKYWNPSLPTTVETIREGSNEPLYLSVEYQCPDRNALEQLKTEPFPKPQLHVRNPKTPHPLLKMGFDPRRRQWKSHIPDPKVLDPVRMTKEVLSHAPRDEIQEIKEVKEVPPPSKRSDAQAADSSETLYTRTVTLPLAALRHHEIWNWIRQHTKLPDHRRTPVNELVQYVEVKQFMKKAEKDRQMVRASMVAMKKEQQELKKAREAAERMAAENM